jgi:hypothetical protein
MCVLGRNKLHTNLEKGLELTTNLPTEGMQTVVVGEVHAYNMRISPAVSKVVLDRLALLYEPGRIRPAHICSTQSDPPIRVFKFPALMTLATDDRQPRETWRSNEK